MEMIWRDLLYSFRTLRRSPGFSLVVILILALGIGANTAIFSVISAVILKPLPYQDPERLMMLPAVHRPNEQGTELALANYLDWRKRNRTFKYLGAYAPVALNMTGREQPERIQGTRITPDALAALGAKPLLGRTFLLEEETADARVAILSYGFWKSHFGGDPKVIGQIIHLSGFEYPIVGVMPQDFRFPNGDVQVWVPIRLTENWVRNRQERFLYVLGRLKDGVSIETAQQDMDAVTNGLAIEFPDLNTNWGVRLIPLQEHLMGKVRPALLILLTTVLLVLILACANIANLQLVRAATRRTEMAIRSAMGASTTAIFRQLLLEGLILAVFGALLGLLLASWSLDLLIAFSPDYIPRIDEITIDGSVLLFTLGLSILTGLIFGLVPSRSALRPDLVGDLQQGTRGASSGASHIRLRRLLTVAEVATALVLLISAGLLLASLMRLLKVEPGFNPKDVFTMEIVLSSVYNTEELRATFFRKLADGTAEIPGVVAAGGVSDLPLSGTNATSGYYVEGQVADPDDPPEAGYRGVTPGYFNALQIPMLQGRDFTYQDNTNSPRVVIVNKMLADLYWPKGDAIGKWVVMLDRSGEKQPHEIIGVIGNVRHTALDVPTVPEIYVTYHQHAYWNVVIITARSKGNVVDLSKQMRTLVASIDPDQPVSKMRTMERVLAESTSEPKFYTSLLSAFAGLALILSTLGIYSIISYSAAQRRHELGIRMALGAQRGDILSLVIREGIIVGVAGILAGLFGAWMITRGLASLLFGVEASDPLIFLATALLLGGVALLASFIPALRASRINPMIAFRT